MRIPVRISCVSLHRLEAGPQLNRLEQGTHDPMQGRGIPGTQGFELSMESGLVRIRCASDYGRECAGSAHIRVHDRGAFGFSGGTSDTALGIQPDSRASLRCSPDREQRRREAGRDGDQQASRHCEEAHRARAREQSEQDLDRAVHADGQGQRPHGVECVVMVNLNLMLIVALNPIGMTGTKRS